MAEQDLDRNEPATPHKLQKAREKGQASRSADLTGAIVLLAAMLYAAAQGGELVIGLLRLCRRSFQFLASEVFIGPMAAAAAALVEAGALMLPFFVVLLVAAAAGTWVQTRALFSLEPLKADLQRLAPGAALRRVFSVRSLFDALRTVLKMAVVVAVGFWSLRALAPRLTEIGAQTAWTYLGTALDQFTALGLKLALLLGAVAVLDAFFGQGEFARRMRMSRRELKDENREREGDPRIRGRLRELRREMSRRSRALRQTCGADVVLTNPTHYAVALRYVHGEMSEPRLVAKGAGHLAAAMREIAWRHRVTVVCNPALTRRLFREVGIDEGIPPAFHAEVARLIVWVFAMRAQRSPGAAA